MKYCLGKEKQCYVCGKKCEKKDVLLMEQGRTGFAGHNEIETTVKKPVFKY